VELLTTFLGMFFLFYLILYISGVGIAEYLSPYKSPNKWILSIFCGLFLISFIGSYFFLFGKSLAYSLPFIFGIALAINGILLSVKPFRLKPSSCWGYLSFSTAIIYFLLALVPIFILKRWTPTMGPCSDQVAWSTWTRYLLHGSLPVKAYSPFNPSQTQETFLNVLSRFGFHILQGMATLLLRWKNHLAYPIATAFSISLLPLAMTYVCENFFSIKRPFVFLAQVLVLGNYFFMWENFDCKSPQVLLLSVLPITIALTAIGIDKKEWKSRILAALAICGFTCIYQEMLSIYALSCLLFFIFSFLSKKEDTKEELHEFFRIIALSAVFLAPHILNIIGTLRIAESIVSTKVSGDAHAFLTLSELFGIGAHFTNKVAGIPAPRCFHYIKMVFLPFFALFTFWGMWNSPRKLWLMAMCTGGVMFGVYFKVLHPYSYAYYKVFLNYAWIAWIALVGCVLAMDKAWRSKAKWIGTTLFLVYIPMLTWYQYQLISTVTERYIPQLPQVEEAVEFIQKNIPTNQAIMIRDEAYNVERHWLIYFLRDYKRVSLPKYSAYLPRLDYPFYRNAITEPFILANKPPGDSSYWSERVVWENERYTLYKKSSNVLLHARFNPSDKAKPPASFFLDQEKKAFLAYKNIPLFDTNFQSKSKDFFLSDIYVTVNSGLILWEGQSQRTYDTPLVNNWIVIYGNFNKKFSVEWDKQKDTSKSVRLSSNKKAISIPIISNDFSVRIKYGFPISVHSFMQICKKPIL